MKNSVFEDVNPAIPQDLRLTLFVKVILKTIKVYFRKNAPNYLYIKFHSRKFREIQIQKIYIMRKILFLTSFLLLGVIGTSNAQLEEGNFMLGADIGSGLVNPASDGLLGINIGLDEGSGYNIGLSPKAGYMITDDFLLGAIVNLGYSKESEDSDEIFVYGIQALSRFYVTPGEADVENTVPAGNFFLETNAGLAGRNVTGGDTTNGFAFGFGPGYSYFLNSNVALEGSVKYNGLVGAGSDNYQNSLGINVGIQIFFAESDAEDAIEDFD